MNNSFVHTSNYAQYRRYRELKRQWRVEYKGINLVEACAIDLIDTMVVGSTISYYHMMCALLQRIVLAPLKEAFARSRNVFTFAFPKRRDHLALSNAMVASVEDSTQVVLSYYYTPYKCVRRWLRFIRQVSRLPLSMKNKAYIAAKMAGYSCVIDELEECFRDDDLRGKRLIPSCATIYYEALLVLFFRRKGVTTFYTLHGVFGRYKQVIANDVVNGENILTDYVLTFGESQRQDLIRDFDVKPDRIKVAGNPKYLYHPIAIRNTFHSCLILGGVWMYDAELRQLLLEADKVAGQLNITMALKPHPLSKIYEDEVWGKIEHITLLDKSATITSLFASGKYDFAITHNTSSYYECMIAGLKPYRWGNNENIDFEGLDDRFCNAGQLAELLQAARQTPAHVLSAEAEQVLKSVVGYGLNNYNQLINGSLQ